MHTSLKTSQQTLTIEDRNEPVQFLLVFNPEGKFSYIRNTQDNKYYGPFTTKYILFFVLPKNLNQEEEAQFIETVHAAYTTEVQKQEWNLDINQLQSSFSSDADLLNNAEAFSIAPKSEVAQEQEPLPIAAP